MNCLSLMGSNQDCPKASSELASYHMKTIITSNMHQFTSYHISKEDATCESMPDDGSWTSSTTVTPLPPVINLVTLYCKTSSAAFIKKSQEKEEKKLITSLVEYRQITCDLDLFCVFLSQETLLLALLPIDLKHVKKCVHALT